MATWSAASPSYADVVAAIALASAGDTVTVPAGAATWSTPLVMTTPIILQGPGKANLTITSACAASAFLWTYSPTTGTTTPFRVTGITFNLNNASFAFKLYNSGNLLPITNVRVDHNSFLNCLGDADSSFSVKGAVWGVIDNNTITGVFVADIYGNNSCDEWLTYSSTLGTANAMFIEDNDITSSRLCVVSTGQGSAVVFRHNTVVQTLSTWITPIDVHGNQTSGVTAARFLECYENTFSFPNNNNGDIFDHRGGKAVIFNNIFDSIGNLNFRVREEYCNSITCGGVYDMSVKESYYWSNYDGNPTLLSSGDLTLANSCVEYDILEDAAFWIHQAGFDGSTGMGVGLLAARPSATGLADGIGYWATDTRILYRVVTETWTEYYTPYDYPHPLREEPASFDGFLWGDLVSGKIPNGKYTDGSLWADLASAQYPAEVVNPSRHVSMFF